MGHFSNENIGLITSRQGQAVGGDDWNVVFACKYFADQNIYRRGGGTIFPLYLYPEASAQQEMKLKHQLDEQELLELRKEELLTLIHSSEESFKIIQKIYNSVQNPDKDIQKLFNSQIKNLQKLKNELHEVQIKLSALPGKKTSVNQLFEPQIRVPNLNRLIVRQISDRLGLAFTNEKSTLADPAGPPDRFAPIDLLDYIYAVLHSPAYRETYKEFLKIDFPRVPYPKDQETFWQLVGLGGQLRQTHLLESPVVERFITQYPTDGDNVVGKIAYQEGKVYINETQYFSGVPQVAWEFYIGGYQPAQKWLKDRKDRQLSFEDILHYQKIIAALSETDRLMKEIDAIDFM